MSFLYNTSAIRLETLSLISWSGVALLAALINLHRLVMLAETHGKEMGAIIFGDKVEIGNSGRVESRPQRS